jgi:hypothetical protein
LFFFQTQVSLPPFLYSFPPWQKIKQPRSAPSHSQARTPSGRSPSRFDLDSGASWPALRLFFWQEAFLNLTARSFVNHYIVDGYNWRAHKRGNSFIWVLLLQMIYWGALWLESWCRALVAKECTMWLWFLEILFTLLESCDNPPRKIPYYRLKPIHCGH